MTDDNRPLGGMDLYDMKDAINRGDYTPNEDEIRALDELFPEGWLEE